MDEVQEGVTIRVEEDKTRKKSLIKDYDYKVDLNFETEKEIRTPKMNTFIDAVILSTNKPCELMIYFDGLEEIKLFDVPEFVGTEYLPLRLICRDFKNHKFNYSQVRWSINNRLRIKVRGAKGTQVNVTLRCYNG